MLSQVNYHCGQLGSTQPSWGTSGRRRGAHLRAIPVEGRGGRGSDEKPLPASGGGFTARSCSQPELQAWVSSPALQMNQRR